jgi:hypothetical protein
MEFNRRNPMKAFLASAALVALSLSAPSAQAQQSGRYCLTGSGSGVNNCSFETMEQCRAAMKGTNNTESCSPNANRPAGGPSPSGGAGDGEGKSSTGRPGR